MQNNERTKRISAPVAVFVCIQVIFLALIIISIRAFTGNDKIENRSDRPTLSLEGLATDESSGFSRAVVDDIRHSLTETVLLNTPNLDSSGTKAIVRDGSLKIASFDHYGFSNFSVIVDLPDLRQSYQIFYKYPVASDSGDTTDNNPRTVLCLDDNYDIIYPEFDCKAAYPPETRRQIASDYLKFFDFDYFSAYIEPKNPSTIVISPSVSYDNDDETKARYIDEVKSAVESLGLSPDSFTYYVRTAEDVNYYN